MAKQIGEKGVGLKFVIFSTSQFSLESSDDQGRFGVNIQDAASWLASSSDNSLTLTLEKRPENTAQGTTVTLKLSDPSHPIF